MGTKTGKADHGTGLSSLWGYHDRGMETEEDVDGGN